MQFIKSCPRNGHNEVGKSGEAGGEGWEPACKPGSVGDSHSSRMRVATHLQRPTREHARAARRGRGRTFPYLVLLRVGFTLPPMLPSARCALTAPFHPYRSAEGRFRRSIFCGTFRGLAPPRRYLAPCPMEPGLSSPPTALGGEGATARPTPKRGNITLSEATSKRDRPSRREIPSFWARFLGWPER